MIIEKLGCSHRMAVQAKRLASERGILATQDSKRGRLLAAEIAECVKSLYYRRYKQAFAWEKRLHYSS